MMMIMMMMMICQGYCLCIYPPSIFKVDYHISHTSVTKTTSCQRRPPHFPCSSVTKQRPVSVDYHVSHTSVTKQRPVNIDYHIFHAPQSQSSVWSASTTIFPILQSQSNVRSTSTTTFPMFLSQKATSVQRRLPHSPSSSVTKRCLVKVDYHISHVPQS